MGKQIFSFKGMMRDLSVSKNPSNYAYEIRNMRLTAQEDSTLLSLVTEKGNREFAIKDSSGDPVTLDNIIGYCTVGKYLTVFTHGETDSIVRLEEKTASPSYMEAKILYQGDLNFEDSDGKVVEIDSLGCYENENIQKVYWVDGVNQPRLINITASDDEISNWSNMETPFDFIPALGFTETVDIKKVNYNGLFAPGTLQYALTYYKRNGQQSNVFYTSPMYYTSHSNRGASPEDSVSNAFEIKVYNPDTSFDFIRVYSMLRTSQDDAPVCKRVYDIPTATLQSHYQGRRYLVEDGISSTPVEAYPQTQYFSSLEDIKIIKQDSSEQTRYDIIDFDDFLYSINGSVKQYIIPNISAYKIVEIGSNPIESTASASYTVYSASYHCYLRITYDFSLSSNNVILENVVRNSDGSYSQGTGDNKLMQATYTFVNYGINDSYVSIIDNGLIGESCNLEEIIYAGGQPIVPKTLSQKNNTLFFGNYKLKGYSFTEEEKNIINAASEIFFGYSDTDIPKGNLGDYYIYESQLNLSSKEITTFKGGETYYFGAVFQDKTGQWSDVVPLRTYTNNYYVHDENEFFKPVKAFIKFDFSIIGDILDNFVNVKIVTADIKNTIICQGVLCPTIFSKKRESNSPYSQASWYFRDVRADGVENNRPQAKNYYNIVNNYTSSDSVLSGEIQYASTTRAWYYSYAGYYDSISEYDRFVDWNIITLNSPEIDFSTINPSDLKLRIVGVLPITGGVSSRLIEFDGLPASYDIMNVFNPNIKNNNNSITGYEIELCNYNYQDRLTSSSSSTIVDMPIYPWHRTPSLHCAGSPTDDRWFSPIKIKIMSSLRVSSKTLFLTDKWDAELEDIKIFNKEDSLSQFIKTAENTNSMYNGAVDDLLVSEIEKINYYKNNGVITSDSTTKSSGTDTSVSMKYKSTSHAVMSLKSDTGTTIELLPNLQMEYGETTVPIHSIETDSSYYLVKCIDIGTITTTNPYECNAFSMVNFSQDQYINQLYTYIFGGSLSDYPAMISHTWRTADLVEEGEFPTVLAGNNNGLKDSVFSSSVSDIIDTYNLVNNEFVIIKFNYNSNDRLILCRVKYSSSGTKIVPVRWKEDLNGLNNIDFISGQQYRYEQLYSVEETGDRKLSGSLYEYIINVKVKYYSSGNTIVNYITFNYRLLDYIYYTYRLIHNPITGDTWRMRYNSNYNNMYILKTSGYASDQVPVGTSTLTLNSPTITLPTTLEANQAYMYVADLYIKNYMFDELLYKNVTWYPASMSYNIHKTIIPIELGDTYYQRYDCLKTFPYTHEDINQIIEIFSFMCETRINIDGRYDQYRGFNDNTVIAEEKFNSINNAYTQKNSIFSYHYLDANLFLTDYFPNRVLWTKTKNPAEEIDSWTQIQTLSELDMDGIFGPISTLRLFNDNLLCWQSKGFARIQYNDRNAIATSSGVPVELANSGKVDGKTYISTEHGCDNMNTVQITPSGVYFTDSNTRDLMKYGQDGLFSLSKAKGFNSYMNSSVTDLKESKTFYDPKLQDVYFENKSKIVTNIPQILYYNKFRKLDNYIIIDNNMCDYELGQVNGYMHFTNRNLCLQGKGYKYNADTEEYDYVNLYNYTDPDIHNFSDKAVYTGNNMIIDAVEYCIYYNYNAITDSEHRLNTEKYILIPLSAFNNYKTLYDVTDIIDAKIPMYFLLSNTFYEDPDVTYQNTEYCLMDVVKNKKETLLYNEQLNEFTSFMDYDMDFLLHLQDSIISIKGNSLYKQFDGDYLTFFGSVKDYSIEFIANENPLADKIFTNLEFRADVINPNTGGLVGTSSTTANSANELPFSKIRVWNEYQDTEDIPLEQMIRRGVNMSQRFRIWRCDIPRDSTKKLDRIRNMWAKVKLSNTGKAFKTVLHDVNVIYYQ